MRCDNPKCDNELGEGPAIYNGYRFCDSCSKTVEDFLEEQRKALDILVKAGIF